MCSVLCVHIQSFSALLEQKNKPELVGRPVVTTSAYAGGEFVVSASPEAVTQGVYDGMTVRYAGRYCPDAFFLAVDWNAYKDASERMLDVLTAYSPLLEPHGLDRAYLDVTGSMALFGDPRAIANDIYRRIWEKIGIAPSVGIAQNKLISYAITTKCKPGKIFTVPSGREKEFLAAADIRILPGLGEKIEKKLHALGVYSVGELASIPERTMARQFGAVGIKLHKLAQGIDHSPVQALYPPNAISISHAFDLTCGACDPGFAETFISAMCERLSGKLQHRNQRTGRVSMSLEFDGGKPRDSSYIPKAPISSADELRFIANRLFKESVHDARLTAMNITASDLKSASGVQLNLLEDNQRKCKLNLVLRNVKNRFGERSLVKGSALTVAG